MRLMSSWERLRRSGDSPESGPLDPVPVLAVHRLQVQVQTNIKAVGVSLFISSSFCLSYFFIVMFDYYKTFVWAVSLMSCWLLWQPVAVFVNNFAS